MGEYEKVYPAYFILQALYSKLGAGVYLYVRAATLDMHARARPPIFRIVQVYSAGVAADYGHTLRCSRSQKSYLHYSSKSHVER